MFRSRLLEHGKAMVAATASAWGCPCWDCRAHRRQVLKLVAIGALLLVGSGGAAWEIHALGRRGSSAVAPRSAGSTAWLAQAVPAPPPKGG